MRITKKWIIIGILIIFAGILIARFSANEDTWICVNNKWEKHGNPTSPIPQSGCGNGQELQSNFKKSGYLSDRETDKANDGIYLVYEEPGAPALSAKLKFDEKSTCVFEERKTICISLNSTIEKIAENKRVSIEGFEYGGVVLVKSLTL